MNNRTEAMEVPIRMDYYYTITGEETFHTLETSFAGLSDEEASARLEKYGKNALREGKKTSLIVKFFEQLKNIMVLTLAIAAVISVWLGETKSAYVIFVVVVLNSILGVIQENKAEKTLEALKTLAAPLAKVRRNGKVCIVKAEELVPGDLVLLEAGDRIPADLRLVEVSNLRVEEAILTGESIPVEKNLEVIADQGAPLGDRRNMAFMGCHATYGRGAGVVTATGMETEMGHIAGQLENAEVSVTPLQRRLNELTKYLTTAIVIISLVIFFIGLLWQREVGQMLLIAVGLAVAAIPEGLPAVITIVLALGVQKMARKNAIIRKLSTVETLGSTQVICSDKTGTLTQNKMTVRELFLDGQLVPSHEPPGKASKRILLEIVSACNDGKVTVGDETTFQAIGDPTETALLEYAAGQGLFQRELDKEFPRVAEIPFDSDRKLMTTINKYGKNLRAMTKGAPDVLLERCTKILDQGTVKPMTDAHLAKIWEANAELGRKALRVLGTAYKDLTEKPQECSSEKVETDLVFVGLTGMIDPPREEVKHAVSVCREAGIKPVMITGDHKETAVAIAKEIGILKEENEALTGRELQIMSDEALEGSVDKFSVYARVSPEHKVRIVKAWKNKGKLVAMTGDGVNDAPALQAADIGVGMGITGTDVSKGVSDMVLSDDNFATIVKAVEEGRKLYSNIRKCIQFLLSTHLGEITTLFLATLFNWAILEPIHLLWVNLITDSLPALALGVEKADEGIMRQRPRDPSSSLFDEGLGRNIIIQGLFKGAITLLAFYIGKSLYSQVVAETIAFATLGLVQLAHSFTVRSNTIPLLHQGAFTNKYLVGAFVITTLLQVVVIAVPALNGFFKVVALNTTQWAIVAGLSFAIVPIVEGMKLLQRISKCS